MAMEVTIKHCEWNSNLVVFYALERCLTAYYVKHIYLKLQHRVYASSIVKLFFCRQTLVVVSVRSLNWDKFTRYKTTVNVVMMVNSLPFGFYQGKKCVRHLGFFLYNVVNLRKFIAVVFEIISLAFLILFFMIMFQYMYFHRMRILTNTDCSVIAKLGQYSNRYILLHFSITMKIINSYQMLPGLY